MQRIHKFIRNNIDTLYENYTKEDETPMSRKKTKSKFALNQQMNKYQFQDQLLNIAEEKMLSKTQRVRMKNINFIRGAIDP